MRHKMIRVSDAKGMRKKGEKKRKGRGGDVAFLTAKTKSTSM